jgi:hypothetical protein
VLDGLLEQSLQEIMPRFVRPVATSGIAGPAERSLRDLPLFGAAERTAPVFHFKDGIRRLLGQEDGGLLVGQIVASLDGIESVLFRGVVGRLGIVGQGGVDPPLCLAGV